MKAFIFVVIATLASASPIDQENERYVWIPDSDGKYHFIDLWDDTEPDRKFKPEEHMRYLLFTRNNPTEYQEIKKGDVESLLNSNFNAENPIVITIHGWTAGHTASSNTFIRNAYLSVEDVNMIAIDWKIGAQTGYVRAIHNVFKASKSVAEFIDWINEVGGAQFSKMHIIGHSLGAQMSGLIGRFCTRGVVEHITALDPALPLWGRHSQRIRKSDAKYVELIHTNAGILGMLEAVGHNDFYINKGRHMPGCWLDIRCSHDRCIHYMAESISSGGFTGLQCMTVSEASAGVQNCTGNQILHMGGTKTKPEIGIFALNTNANSPYSLG